MSAHPEPDCTRRELLQAGVSLAGLGMTVLPEELLRARFSPAAEARGADEGDLLDHALERLHAHVSNDTSFLSNHVPMVVEALASLGQAEAIEPWVDRHLRPIGSEGASRDRIEREQWRESLARPERFYDWRVLFQEELGADEWVSVLRRWTPRLVPGLAGNATHGLIRTGHATRALGRRDNAIRRTELATALAYWAIGYETLPWDESLAPQASVEAALARVEPRLPALSPPRGNIVAGLRALHETPSFLPVAGLVDTRDPERTLSEVTASFACFYLENPERRIPLTHSITAPAALRLLAPHLDEETLCTATRYVWQASAGLYVVYADPRRSAPAAELAAPREDVVARAVANGAPHAIKLTEACLREAALSGESMLIQAAQDGARALSG